MHYAFFPTPLGQAALAWTPQGLWALGLPEPTAALTLESLWVRRPAPPQASPSEAELTPGARLAAEGVRRLLGGEPPLTSLELGSLDLRGLSPLRVQVYDALLRLPLGSTTTYGALAKALGRPGASRAVGRTLGLNPWLVLVPCHRVLGAGGALGGYSAPGGTETKAWLLELESRLQRAQGG